MIPLRRSTGKKINTSYFSLSIIIPPPHNPALVLITCLVFTARFVKPHYYRINNLTIYSHSLLHERRSPIFADTCCKVNAGSKTFSKLYPMLLILLAITDGLKYCFDKLFQFWNTSYCWLLLAPEVGVKYYTIPVMHEIPSQCQEFNSYPAWFWSLLFQKCAICEILKPTMWLSDNSHWVNLNEEQPLYPSSHSVRYSVR